MQIKNHIIFGLIFIFVILMLILGFMCDYYNEQEALNLIK